MITGLVKRRAELAGEIHATHERLGHLVRDLAALDGALAVVAPDMEVEAIRPRMFRPPEDWASRGQMSRLVLTILRQSHDALTTREIERWLGLSEQGSATDKWIVCRLFPRTTDMGRQAGRA
jgi:hypothetical protein